MFQQLVFTETLAKPFSFFANTLYSFLRKKVIKNDPNWYPEMKVAEEVVWIIYY